MTDIRFYHLKTQSLESALPAILTKALEQGRRVLIKTKDAGEAEKLSAHLWTYRPDSFIPHGTAKDGFAADQPVWLTPADENPNAADVLVLTGGASCGKLDDFALCCEIFDGNSETAVKAARTRWKEYEAASHNLAYWQQTEKGWEQKS